MSEKVEIIKSILDKCIDLWESGLCVIQLHPTEKEFLEKEYNIEVEESFNKYFLDIDPTSLLVGWLLDEISNDPKYELYRKTIEQIKKKWADKKWTC